MDMNKHTLSPLESAPTTRSLIFQGLVNNLPSTNPDELTIRADNVKPLPVKNKQRPSFKDKLIARENADPEYKKRMEAARVRLADELSETSLYPIARIRLQKGYSQTTLGTMIGTSQSHIARIESGKVKMLFETAIRMADALNVPIEDLKPATLSDSDILININEMYG